MSLTRVLTQRKGSTADADRENFEKTQAVSISKAINNQETPVKEKHVRNAILGTFHEKGAATFWSCVMKLPLQGNPIVCWKFCHVVHKILREGHQHAIADSLKYRSMITDLGKLWGLLKEGYGKLIQHYCTLLVAKLDFHRRNPRFPGNLIVTDEELDDIGERDVNVFFQLSCEMFDYMDEILNLQKAVFGSLDMSRSNSMTNAGQCRLSPLIMCIQDSSPLYHYTVQLLFKLHSALPADTLAGHRDRFLKQFQLLKQFYHTSNSLQYFKHLVQVDPLPENPPNFLIASDLKCHVGPVVILPPQVDTPENETVDMNLIDTSVSNTSASPNRFDEIFGSSSMGEFSFQQQNGSISPDHGGTDKKSGDDKLAKELEYLQMEIQRISIEYERKIDSLKRRIAELESQIAEQERLIQLQKQENEELKKQLADSSQSSELATKLEEAEKQAKVQGEKFLKMRDVYSKLREEHVSLIRGKADVEKQLKSTKASYEEVQKKNQELNEQLQSVLSDKSAVEEKLQKSDDSVLEKIASLTTQKEEIERIRNKLETDLQEVQSQKTSLEEQVKDLLGTQERLKSELEMKETTIKKDKEMLEEEMRMRRLRILKSVIEEAESIIQNVMEDMDNPGHASVTCTPEYFLQHIEPVKGTLEELNTSFGKFSDSHEEVEDLLRSVTLFTHQLADLLVQGKATSQSSPNVEQGDELASNCKTLGVDTLHLFDRMKSKEAFDNVPSAIAQVKQSLLKVGSLTEVLLPDMKVDEMQKLGSMVEEEMAQMDRDIEEAARRIEELLHKSRAGDSGIKLEVNEKILDACTALMQSIRVLVSSSKELQEEIVSQGKGSASVTEFYNRNHRWTEGLISAAKVVGMAAKFLVNAADKVISGEAKFEEIVVASQEIAAATAQLVVSSKVKAERGSLRLAKLSSASRSVAQATANVVATTKNCAELVEESEVMDFSKLTLHQAKRLEMECQVRVLELESSLQKERIRLAGLRKRHYHLAGPSEGWDQDDYSK